MDLQNIPAILKLNYNKGIHDIKLLREGGNYTYVVQGTDKRYFLKIIRRQFMETALTSLDIQLYLLQNGFPVIPIIPTKEGLPSIRINERDDEYLFILYEFITGVGEVTEPANSDLETAGYLLGRLHKVMKSYTGQLVVRDKQFFIDRYVKILKIIQYPKAELFGAYGDEIWSKIRHLPRGFCHGDMYDGNIHKAEGGAMYVVDFDTSCNAFPMYDIVLFCNRADFFKFHYNGYHKTRRRLYKFLTGYQRHSSLSEAEISAFNALRGMYQFMQGGMMELLGYDRYKHDFFDRQYELLLRWREQCMQKNNW